jgi:hypothetical protein
MDRNNKVTQCTKKLEKCYLFANTKCNRPQKQSETIKCFDRFIDCIFQE